jgi:pimeloyl-ACP methyl ester carboxylesterase
MPSERGSSLERARQQAGVRTARLSDGVTAYHVEGERGPWVVLVNGLLTPMYPWESLSSALAAAGYRVLRYDLLGRGLSDRPALRYDLALFTRQLHQLTRALGIEAAHFVGWSMGCVICSQLALEHPELVQKLVLIAPGLFMDPPLVLRVASRLPFSRHIIGAAARVFTELLPWQHVSQAALRPAYTRRLREQLRYPGLGDSFASTVTHYPFGAGPEYRSVGDHPRQVLLLWGDRDTATPYANAPRVLALFPRAELVTLRGARHAPHVDRAGATEAAILELLGRQMEESRRASAS